MHIGYVPMTTTPFEPALKKTLLALQKGEITEYHIYTRIAEVTSDPRNREVLTRIAKDELGHYAIWKRYTQQDVAPGTLRIWFYYLIARVFGMTFAI
jgi:demethoxyubiquinone hydroxylase (CLK1/Coq7/Cat5 family)